MDSNFIFILTGFIAILIMGVLCGVGMDDEAKVSNANSSISCIGRMVVNSIVKMYLIIFQDSKYIASFYCWCNCRCLNRIIYRTN